MHHDKVFLSWFLPLAIATFLSAPLAVLHSFDMIDPMVTQLHKYGSLALFGSVETSEALPTELPLLIRMESYPYSGKKILEVYDTRIMDMAFKDTNSNENLSASPLLFGYIPLIEMQETRKSDEFSHPEGHLIVVTRVSYKLNLNGNTDLKQQSMVLETKKSHRFRVKAVRKDEVTGLLVGQVEWLH